MQGPVAVNANGGGSTQASPMSVNLVLGGGDEHQGARMEVEQEIRGVEMAPPTPFADHKL